MRTLLYWNRKHKIKSSLLLKSETSVYKRWTKMASPKMQTLLKMHVNFIDKQLPSTVAGKILKARKAPFVQRGTLMKGRQACCISQSEMTSLQPFSLRPAKYLPQAFTCYLLLDRSQDLISIILLHTARRQGASRDFWVKQESLQICYEKSTAFNKTMPSVQNIPLPVEF